MQAPYNFYDILSHSENRAPKDRPSLSDSYTELIKKLSLCAPRIGSGEESFGEVLFEVLSRDILFSQIDRICLAERVLGSNQLLILDCFLNPECGENKMKPGYSCYVDPQSSLFKMENGQFRVYSDQLSIIESYAKDEKPLQRSIRKIFSMGMQGGLAIPLSYKKTPYAFIFLNSRSASVFKDLQIEDYLVLNYITGLATQAYNVIKHLETSAPEFSQSTAAPYTIEGLWGELTSQVPGATADSDQLPLSTKILLNPNVVSSVFTAIRIAADSKSTPELPLFRFELDEHAERFFVGLHFSSEQVARLFFERLRQVLTLATVDVGLQGTRIMVGTHSESRFFGEQGRFYSI